MDYSVLASGISIAGVIITYLSFMRDKLKSAEEFGALKQKVNHLENQSRSNEQRFQNIEAKLDTIQRILTRLETLLKTDN